MAVVVVADQLFDIDTAVPQGAAFTVGFGDLGLEGDDALEAVLHHLFGHGRTLPIPVLDSALSRA